MTKLEIAFWSKVLPSQVDPQAKKGYFATVQNRSKYIGEDEGSLHQRKTVRNGLLAAEGIGAAVTARAH